jgi:signal transduction histidine kinase/sensor domain CHASE-containing protein
MSINRKIILLVVGITVLIFLVMFFVSNYFYLSGFEELETKTVQQNVQQVSDALAVRLGSLDSFCVDWAEWDDTYYHAQNLSEDYVNLNLTDDTFTNSDINIFLVFNPVGELIFGKSYDGLDSHVIPLPANLVSVLPITGEAELSEGVKGVTDFFIHPSLVSCHPILTSLKEGPSTGYLMVGQFINTELIGSISETVHLPSGSLTISIPGDNATIDAIMPELALAGSIYVQTVDDSYVSGYEQINDLSGMPAFILEVTVPREIYNEGTKVLTYVRSSLLVIAIVFGVVFFLFLRYLILNRLTTLTNAVNAIGSRGEISRRVNVKGSDEISRLADNINGMLTSLEKSESRRQSQKEIIANIVAMTPDGMIALDNAGYITLINDAFRTMFDLNNRSMLGVKAADLPELGKIAVEIEEFRQNRMISAKKEIYFTRYGNKKIFIAHFVRLKEEEVCILYLSDVTDERSKQESLYLTDRLASIGEMASGIAHELNNPLTSIIGLSEIVTRGEVPESVKEDMSLIKSESHRAAGIVRNLLSFARKATAVKQPTQINKTIYDVLKLRSYEHGLRNIKVIKELDPDLPEIMIDPAQIQQVFINIILNAEYAMINAYGKGTLTIKSGVAGNMLKVSFTDDGPGIEPANLKRVFDPFFTTKEAGKGTGLGLSICYGIINAHYGNICAVSEPGKGASFIIELPLHTSGIKETKTDV